MESAGAEPTVIRGASVPTPRGFRDAELRMEDGVVWSLGRRVPHAGARLVQAGGGVLVPGFIDCHLHGAVGRMFEEGTEDAAAAIADYLPRCGVTGVVATLAALPPDALLRAVEAISRAANRDRGARILGIHLEGPFLNPDVAGAQAREWMRPASVAEFEKLQAASGGCIRIVTVAPELPGALDFIAAVRARGVTVALGHSNATEAEARSAFDAGATHVVHLWNAMRPFHHREPGLAGAALMDDRVSVEVVCDGQHVAPSAVDLVLRAKPIEKVVPVSDAVAALGLPDGEIDLFGLPCVIRDGAVRRRKDGRLAGSAAGLDQALRNLRAWRPSLAWHDLLHMPSSASRVIGCGDVYGRIAIGGSGDVVLLDADLNVLETWREGRSRFQATAAGK